MVFCGTFSIDCFHTVRQHPLLSHFPLQESLSKKNQIMDHFDWRCEERQYLMLIMFSVSPAPLFLVVWWVYWLGFSLVAVVWISLMFMTLVAFKYTRTPYLIYLFYKRINLLPLWTERKLFQNYLTVFYIFKYLNANEIPLNLPFKNLISFKSLKIL